MQKDIPLKIERPARFADEKHARAIIKNWLSHEEAKTEKSINNLAGHPEFKSRKQMVKYTKKLKEAYGEMLINYRDSNEGKRTEKLPRYIEISMLSFRYKATDESKTKLLPMLVTVIDTKSFDPPNLVTMCNISEHALARLLMRSEAKSLKEVNSILEPYAFAVVAAAQMNKIPTSHFSVITHDGYIPFVWNGRPGDRNHLVAKTFISRDKWNRKTEAKLAPKIKDLPEDMACIEHTALTYHEDESEDI